MKNNLSALFVGFLFALGLGLSGMTNPEKVIGFLDIFGNWNPSLLFVMGGSILVHFFSYRMILRRQSPLFSKQWYIPQNKQINLSLIVGSLIFGLGWGLAGYCPGPALVSLSTLQTGPFTFVLSMIIGMYLFLILDKKVKFKR